MNIISIDPSVKCTGIYINYNDKGNSYSITPRGKYKLANFYQTFEDIILNKTIDIAFIEDYAYSDHLAGKRSMSEFVGVIKLFLEQLSIPWIAVPISTWQSYMTKGFPKKKNKADYLQAVEKRYNIKFETTDEADAWMIYGAMYLIAKGFLKTKTAVKLYNKMKYYKVFENLQGGVYVNSQRKIR